LVNARVTGHADAEARRLVNARVTGHADAEANCLRHEAERVFGGQLVVREAPITRWNVEGQRAALIDILLLSFCDDIITTQMSTFSYVAHALSSTPAARRSGNSDHDTTLPLSGQGVKIDLDEAKAAEVQVPYVVTMQGTCVRDVSSQPCLHAWRHIVLASDCFLGELPFLSSPETRGARLRSRNFAKSASCASTIRRTCPQTTTLDDSDYHATALKIVKGWPTPAHYP
ncbi:hypothetical protein T484DRAFT_1768898, partial [Baffinella frigidus]